MKRFVDEDKLIDFIQSKTSSDKNISKAIIEEILNLEFEYLKIIGIAK